MVWNFWWSQNPLKSSLLLSPSLLLLLLNFHYFQIVPSTALLIPHSLKDITTVLCFTVQKICTPRSWPSKVGNTVYDCTYSHFKNEHFQTPKFCSGHGPLFSSSPSLLGHAILQYVCEKSIYSYCNFCSLSLCHLHLCVWLEIDKNIFRLPCYHFLWHNSP